MRDYLRLDAMADPEFFTSLNGPTITLILLFAAIAVLVSVTLILRARRKQDEQRKREARPGQEDRRGQAKQPERNAPGKPETLGTQDAGRERSAGASKEPDPKQQEAGASRKEETKDE